MTLIKFASFYKAQYEGHGNGNHHIFFKFLLSTILTY